MDQYVTRLIELAKHHTIIERGRAVWTGTWAELDAGPFGVAPVSGGLRRAACRLSRRGRTEGRRDDRGS